MSARGHQSAAQGVGLTGVLDDAAKPAQERRIQLAAARGKQRAAVGTRPRARHTRSNRTDKRAPVRGAQRGVCGLRKPPTVARLRRALIARCGYFLGKIA